MQKLLGTGSLWTVGLMLAGVQQSQFVVKFWRGYKAQAMYEFDLYTCVALTCSSAHSLCLVLLTSFFTHTLLVKRKPDAEKCLLQIYPECWKKEFQARYTWQGVSVVRLLSRNYEKIFLKSE